MCRRIIILFGLLSLIFSVLADGSSDGGDCLAKDAVCAFDEPYPMKKCCPGTSCKAFGLPPHVCIAIDLSTAPGKHFDLLIYLLRILYFATSILIIHFLSKKLVQRCLENIAVIAVQHLISLSLLEVVLCLWLFVTEKKISYVFKNENNITDKVTP